MAMLVQVCNIYLISYASYITGSQAFRNAVFGEGSGVIFLEGLECDGTESSLLDCPMDVELGLSICDHSDDAGIRCYGTYVHTCTCTCWDQMLWYVCTYTYVYGQGSDAMVCTIWCRCPSLCVTDCMIYFLHLVLVQAIPKSYTV